MRGLLCLLPTGCPRKCLASRSKPCALLRRTWANFRHPLRSRKTGVCPTTAFLHLSPTSWKWHPRGAPRFKIRGVPIDPPAFRGPPAPRKVSKDQRRHPTGFAMRPGRLHQSKWGPPRIGRALPRLQGNVSWKLARGGRRVLRKKNPTHHHPIKRTSWTPVKDSAATS